MPGTRSGFVGVVGLPNAGKSTLINRLLGKHVLAVSARPQTTRQRLVAVRNVVDAGQIAYVDTPGMQQGRGPLRRFMAHETIDAASGGDAALLLIDATGKRAMPAGWVREETTALLAALANLPVVVALNKVDRVDKPALLPMIEAWANFGGCRVAAVVPISAAHGDNLAAMERELVAVLPEAPAMFPADVSVDRGEQYIAAELIREQLFSQLREELPYTTAVEIEAFDDRDDDILIHAAIIVERDSQKGIVIGRGGAQLRSIGERARKQLSETFGCPVHIKLFVKVRTGWTEDEHALTRMGYGLERKTL